MDAYSGYNQIPMHRPDEDKTAFITLGGIYCYKIMPFGLKNAGATYQRLMSRVFHDLIGKTEEVYVDDILVKTAEPSKLINDLQAVFEALRKFKIRLNPLKCAFAMEARKFLGFMITQRGVEANPDKCEAVLNMTSPGCIKDAQRLTGKLTALSRFLGASAERAMTLGFLPVEYEALIGGTNASQRSRSIKGGSQQRLPSRHSQVNGSYQARDALLQKYLEKVRELCKSFEEVTIQHVPRERNARADLLSKLASTKPDMGNRSLIKALATEPAIIMFIAQAPNPPSWINPISRYLEHAETPADEKEAQAIKREAPKYTIIQGQLYKRGLHQPLLKYLRPDETDYVLREVLEGCCGHHIGGRSLARKIIRVGYYWPTMMSDARKFVKKCKKCQENASFHKAPHGELSLMMAPRPFTQWGVDLLGPFPPGPG
ncbi:uncharacterized protein LOC130949742 [Arachis stenosperma]|uniref:uncharacterized protein LOC130949742 n=1 Tax=Arachis stenosperma TaxID=217475 RepID=UPI0025ABE2EE|nr:uncharacterized protein LOC130949742 [Arachis stenosperma]